MSLPLSFKRTLCSFELMLLAVFVLCVTFGLHGFSLPSWYQYLGITDNSAILIGKSQDIRSDDWNTFLPLALSQAAHLPGFPVINQNIGLGLNMLVPYALPVLHPLTLFRPSAWGFFLGADAGLAWLWCFQFLGLFYVYHLVFLIISKDKFWLSLLGSTTLLFSAFVQNWALNCAPFAIFAGLVFVATERLLFKPFGRTSYLYLVLLVWSALSFATFIYPPYQISVAYYLLFILAALFWERSAEFKLDPKKWQRLLLLAVAALTSLLGVLYFFSSIKDVQAIIENTAYPGRRISTGRDYDLGWLFGGNFFNTDIVRDWTQYSNICELSSFVFVFPLIAPFVLGRTFGRLRAYDKFSLLLLVHLGLSLYYMFFGFSEQLSKLTLLSYVPAHRNLIGLGLANTTLLVSFLSRVEKSSKREFAIFALPGFALWAWLLWQGGTLLSSRFRELTPDLEQLVIGSTLLWGLLLFNKRASYLALAILAGVLFYNNAGFNPLVRGGTKQIFEHKLSQRILKIQANDPDARWVSYSNLVLSNLPRMLGVSSISGLYPYPDLPLWQSFDPTRKFEPVYNRYAHVVFEIGEGSQAHFSTPQPDLVVVSANPALAELKLLNVRYFIVVGGASAVFDRNPIFKRVFRDKDKFIYKRID